MPLATRLLLCAAAWLAACGAVRADDATEVRLLDRAELIAADGSARAVRLPFDAGAPRAGSGAASVHLRWQIDLPAPPGAAQALYFPGLVGYGRISVNGQTLLDHTPLASPRTPRLFDRVALVQVPAALWRAGPNIIDLQAEGGPHIRIDAPELGPADVLSRHQRWRILGPVVGQMVVASVLGALGLCIAALWWRLSEPMLGYFALGALAWALLTAWTALPLALVPRGHFQVWWNSLYMFVVAMLVLFCLRFANWRWPRVERGLWVAALCSPFILYVSKALIGGTDPAAWWRLVWIGVALLGVAAVAREAWRRRNRDSLLITLTGAIGLAFGIHDWLGNADDPGAIELVPYAGLPFVAVVVYMLIERFLGAVAGLEQMNASLERRVAEQNAELHTALDQMRQARDAAEAADQAKSSFLAAASHDLRQPAHALGLYLAALQAQPLPARQGELVRRMSSSLAALDMLFNALLDVSRIDAGAVVPRARAFALAPLLRRLADEFAPQAEARGLRLALRLPPEAESPRIHSDPLLVERILRNLLGNAIKYSDSGGVLLACRRRGAGRAAACWRLEVWDSGSGIAPADQARVFDEFFQVGNTERERQAGLGLGLSIVKRLVRLLGAELVLRSRPGHGSGFLLALPACDAQPAEDAPRPARTPRLDALEGLAVAVLEDDADVRQALTTLLEYWGCRVAGGADAAELIDALGSDDFGRSAPAPQAVIADYRLRAGRTGLAELQSLFDHWGGAVPALLLTGESSPQALREIGSHGHTCLAKPLAPERLRLWLADVARRAEHLGVAS